MRKERNGTASPRTIVSDETGAYPFPLGPDEGTARKLCVMLMREKLDELVAEGRTDAVERYVNRAEESVRYFARPVLCPTSTLVLFFSLLPDRGSVPGEAT